MSMTTDWKILEIIKEIIGDHLNKTIFVLGSLKNLAKEYKNREAGEQDPFNIVLASSDRYYYENLHSEILAALLRRSDFSDRFIAWLNTLPPSLDIDKSNYVDHEVTVEEGRIDVLLKSRTSMRCIIIENKINDAVDRDRQIPIYVEQQKLNGYTVDAIFYLSLDGKPPNKHSWEPGDHDQVDHILICAGASNRTGKHTDMVSGFLANCISDKTTLQEYCFISQYIDLLKFLGRKQMDDNLMRQFYDKMREDDNYQTANSIRSMLDQLTEYRYSRLGNKFKHSEYRFLFKSIFGYPANKPRILVFERLPNFPDRSVAEELFKIHVDCSNNEFTRVELWVQDPRTEDDIISNLLEKIKLSESFSKLYPNDYFKDFTFPQEEEALGVFLEDILKRLYEYIPK